MTNYYKESERLLETLQKETGIELRLSNDGEFNFIKLVDKGTALGYDEKGNKTTWHKLHFALDLIHEMRERGLLEAVQK